MKRGALTLALGLLLMLPAHADPVDVARLPASQKDNYDAFRARCSKCHTLDKPLNAHMSPDQWRRYVGKMKRRPGSGINDSSAEQILGFLLFKELPAAQQAEAPADAGP